MFDKVYRQRLEADIARWEADGVIAPAAAAAIRSALPPLAPGITIPVIVAIVGGLLIAAAFLAFVAAHWTELPRLLRFAILVAGICGANGLAAWFARRDRTILVDLCASVSAIIFGAAIALVGQMYHLGEDFAGGMMLWAGGALAAAVLTGSRGALAVALAAGSVWSGMRGFETYEAPHLPFLVLWGVAAGLALTWNSRVAAHLVAVAALPWWIEAAFQPRSNDFQPFFILADGAALVLGAGLLLAALPWARAGFGAVLSAYGAFALAGVAILEVATSYDTIFVRAPAAQPIWAISCGVAGAIFAFAAAVMTRRAGAALAGIAIGLVLIAVAGWPSTQSSGPWLAYAIELGAMVCLIVSGMLDGARPRIVAGWLGIAGVIAGITWAIKSSLLGRSAFLAVAGAVAVALALLLNRTLPRTDK
jgi:uncharacterized membrane protein